MASLTCTVQSTELERNLGSTIIGEYCSKIDSMLLNDLKKDGENIAVPTLGCLLESIPEIKERLINLYNSNMGLVSGVEDIPDDLKASQGALLDGLCFGYDVRNGSFELYTMNFNLLQYINEISTDMLDQCIRKNVIGEVKGYRIDVEYNNNPEYFKFNVVNHRKAIDDSENVLLVPYIVVLRMMKIIESLLNSGVVLKVRQNVRGIDKVRCITKNTRVLRRFCDNENAVGSVGCSFFPLRGFFYAPVVGAPSTTSMVTNVGIYDLCELRSIKSIDQIRSLGIEKPENPMKNAIVESVVCSKLAEMRVDNPWKFKEVIQSFPKAELLGGNVSGVSISKYLHGITYAETDMVINRIPDCKESIEKRCKLFEGKSMRPATNEELKDIGKLLRTYLCHFIIKKKDCKLFSAMGTNSTKILKAIYGEDYFSRYEGFGIRLDSVFNEVSLGRGIEEALNANGFNCDKDMSSRVLAIMEEYGFDASDDARKDIADLLGANTRGRNSTGNSILMRTLDAYITENGVEDYYVNIYPSKITRVLVLD